MPSLSAKILALVIMTALVLALGGASRPVAAQDTGSISGTVYFDTDMDGERDSGEPPAPGRAVELREYDNNGLVSDLLGTAISAADGSYSFTGLSSEKSYEVAVRTDSETPCVTSGSFGFPATQDWTGVDIGVLKAGEGKLSGALVNDLNENGAHDLGEPALEGWVLSLGSAQGGCDLTTTTGPAGEFEFTGLPPVVYGLWPLSSSPGPSGGQLIWEITFPTEPDPDSPIPILDMRTWYPEVDLTRVKEVHGFKMGVHVLEGTGAIAGAAFRDFDLDGIRDEGEPEFACCDFWFARSSPLGMLPLHTPDVLTEDGRFELTGLPAGKYNVTLVMWWPGSACQVSEPEAHPGGWVTLREGERVDNVYFGVCPNPPGPFASPTPAAAAPSPTPIPGPVQVTPTPVPPVVPGIPAVAALPATGAGAAPSHGDLAGLAPALAVAGALALAASALAVRRKARFRR